MNYKHGLKNKIKKCLFCKRDFIAKKDCLTRKQVFCSKKCYGDSLIGIKATKNQLKALELGRYKGKKIGGWKWSDNSKIKLSLSKRGIKFSNNHKKSLSEARLGKFTFEKHPNWKGDKVGYGALHDWVRKVLGIPEKCLNCGIKGKKNGRSWSIHWANKSGKYKREITDWLPLCVRCHKNFDIGQKAQKL